MPEEYIFLNLAIILVIQWFARYSVWYDRHKSCTTFSCTPGNTIFVIIHYCILEALLDWYFYTYVVKTKAEKYHTQSEENSWGFFPNSSICVPSYPHSIHLAVLYFINNSLSRELVHLYLPRWTIVVTHSPYVDLDEHGTTISTREWYQWI